MAAFINLLWNYLATDGIFKILILTTLAFFTYWFYLLRSSKLPPGPWRVPVIGTFILFSKDIYLTLTDARKKYGDVYTVYFGNTPGVILNGYDAVKEAFIKNGEDFQGRMLTKQSQNAKHGYGLSSANGQLWKVQRRFAISTLRDFGMGKSIIEEQILLQASKLVHAMRSQDSKPFRFFDHVSSVVNNVMFFLLLGDSTHPSDPDKMKFINWVADYFAGNKQTNPINFFPWLRFVPGDLFGYQKGIRAGANIMTWITEMVELKKKEYRDDPQKVPSDFIGVFLEQMKKENKKDTTFTEMQLKCTVADLFGAGTETTATTLEWMLIYLSFFPEVQKRMQKELDGITNGGTRQVTWEDRVHLPFTEACIAETQRVSTIAPLSVPHVTTKDVVFRGYEIPANTYVAANLWSIHHDENLYSGPYSFKPERFIDSSGKFEKPKHLIPFSAGPRTCPGESLARMELFLFGSAIMQNFTIFMHDKAEFSKLRGTLGITLKAPELKLIAVPRNI